MRKRRSIFGLLSVVLLGAEILIGMYASGWIRSYLGDVLVVILLYTLFRTVSPAKPEKWYVLPTVILIFAFGVEFLQLWGFCDRFGITDKFLRIIIGTGFSVVDLVCYFVGIIPCYITEYLCKNRHSEGEPSQSEGRFLFENRKEYFSDGENSDSYRC